MSALFVPTWRRVLSALALATAAFLLPQELPLEWYPLNDPGENVNLLQLTFAAHQDGEVQLFYDTGRGFNENESIRIPVAPSKLPYTYTFPLPDAPLLHLRLDPLPGGGVIEVTEFKIINRAGQELRRFTRNHLVPAMEIAAITPTTQGWTVTSAPGAHNPQLLIRLDSPSLPEGMNARNLQRCLLSTGYVAGMLWLLLLTVGAILERPATWRAALGPVALMAMLALLFGAVANRGLIKNSVRHAAYIPPSVGTGLTLEVDLTSANPTLAQLFWNTGAGFNEAESLQHPLEHHQGLQILRFPLPELIIQALRLDPAVAQDRLFISGLRVTDAGGRTRTTIPTESLQSGQAIHARNPSAGGLRVHTAPASDDPILYFSAEAIANINRLRPATTRP